jgi:hypothetical protein
MSRRTGSPRALAHAALALALALTPGRSSAAASVAAAVDRAEIALGETVQLTIRVTADAPPTSLEPPRGPFDFEIVGQSQSQQVSMAFAGGQVQAHHAVEWVLTLAPRRAGALAIPPFTVAVGGERLPAGPVSVKVLPAGSAPRRAPTPPPGPPQLAPAPSAGWSGWERDLWLEVQVDRRRPWLGEQVTASVFLVSPVGVLRIDNARPPSFDGFWSEPLDVPRTLAPTARVVNGIPVRSYLLQRIALFPTRAGKLSIGSFQVDATVQILSGNRLFDPFRSIEQVRRQSAPVELDVRPLPAGAPAGFDAVNVGSLALSVAAGDRSVPAGEPIAVRLTARGEGNVRAWSLPALPPVAGTRRYDPATSEKLEPVAGRIAGSRTVETLLVPERPGELVVPPLELATFDPKAGRYQLVRTAELRIPVGSGAAIAPSSRAIAAELRPIRAAGGLRRAGPPPWEGVGFGLLLLLPPSAVAALAAGGRLRDRARLDAPARRVRGARRAARRRLADADRRLRAGDGPGFLAELERALLGYVADKLGRSVLGLTRPQLGALLAGAGVPPGAAKALAGTLDALDAARFGGGGADAALLDSAAAAMAALEEADWSSGDGRRA